jgi:hypothetical protein
LTTTDVIIGHQHGFNLAHVGRGFPQPGQNRVFLVSGRAGDATDPIPFGELCQGFDNVMGWCLPPIEQRPFRRCERVVTGATLIALLAVASSAKLDDVVVRRRVGLSVISAV